MGSLHEECGVFGVFGANSNNAAAMTRTALIALQHRGQESCGIAVSDNSKIRCIKRVGLVTSGFGEDELRSLGESRNAVGHVRYSTTGENSVVNAQPICISHKMGSLALVHNGNLTNAFELRREFESRGAIYHTTSDTESIAYAITEKRLEHPSIEKALEAAMYDIKGAYSLVVMSQNKLIAARDPMGFRPLCMGYAEDGTVVFASESCALDSVGARFVRDILPGEIVVCGSDGISSIKTHCQEKTSMCVFEFVYFSRPDSVIEGCSVHASRLNAGKILWQEHPVSADIVAGVPDSGLDAALGFSQASGIPYGVCLIKNAYIGRTFIQPSQNMRSNSVRAKLSAIEENIRGKRIVLVDDSIVRGTTVKRIVEILRQAGASQIHLRISSPPFIAPCWFGTDIDSKENLIACQKTIPEIAEYVGADSIGFLSVDGVKKIAQNAKCEFCTGCFTGEYPVGVPKSGAKDKFETKLPQKQG